MLKPKIEMNRSEFDVLVHRLNRHSTANKSNVFSGRKKETKQKNPMLKQSQTGHAQ